MVSINSLNLPLLETTRLKLRPLKKNDYHNMRAIETSPQVMKFLGNGQVRSENDTREYLSKHLRDYEEYGLGLYAVADKKTDQFIGRSGLIPWKIENKVEWEIGYTLLEEYWGKGYATELALYLKNWAKSKMSLNHVVSIINPENVKSINVAQKIGMTYWKQIEINEHSANVYRAFL